MKVAMNGASGFVATALKKQFPNHVVIERNDDVEAILKKLEGVDAVFNLAGAPIVARWNEAYKKVLHSSRIDSTKKLVEAINQSHVSHFISTSAVGIYPNDVPCDEETTRFADDFLGKLALEWEAEAKKCQKATAILRFGVVLGQNGGALEKMLPAFKMGFGGRIGDGKMITSWIDSEDLVAIYAFVLERKLEGIFNATSPQPISNAVFTKVLGEVLHRPTIFPVPEVFIRLAFGEGSTVLLDSKEVYPKALLQKGFTFHYGDLKSSLQRILA